MPVLLAARKAQPVASVRLSQLWQPARAPVGERPSEPVEAAGPATAQPGADESGARGPGWVPPAVRGARVVVDRRAALAVVLVAALGLVGTAWFAWRGASTTVPAVSSVVRPPSPGAAAATTSTVVASPGPSGAAALVVDVAGRVRRPGLVRLPAGSRVADALAAAGGALPGVDLTTLNLARPLGDGEQVLVGASVPGVVGGSGPAATAGSAAGVVDLNTATLEQLESLPGVGPVLAQHILDWRAAHGRFSSVDELGEVGGIGAKKLADIRPKATL